MYRFNNHVITQVPGQTHPQEIRTVYWLCHTFCIFLWTIKKRTSSGMSFPQYVWPEKQIFPEDSSLSSVYRHQDKESSDYGAPVVISSPGVHKLQWIAGTTLLAEGGPPPERGGRLRAATTAPKIAAAACVPAGSVLFEYWFATSYRLGLCCAC